jgi:hypothetical protein
MQQLASSAAGWHCHRTAPTPERGLRGAFWKSVSTLKKVRPPFKPLQNPHFFPDKISNVDSRAVASAFGKDIPAQEGANMLLKLILDRAIVQAVFASSSSSTAALIGVVYPAPGGTAVVKPKRGTQQPILRFDPSAATSFRLGDGRSLPKGAFRGHRVTSALVFLLPRQDSGRPAGIAYARFRRTVIAARPSSSYHERVSVTCCRPMDQAAFTLPQNRAPETSTL